MGPATKQHALPVSLLAMALGLAATDAAAQTLTKGPYFIDVDDTAARVVVETDKPSTLSVRITRLDVDGDTGQEGNTPEEAPNAEAEVTDPGNEAESPAEAEATTQETNVERILETRPWRNDGRALGSLRLRNLTVNTRYRVEIGDAIGEFYTAPTGDENLSFIVYGDNRTQHDRHREVVAAMEDERDIRFVLHTGDFVEVGGRPADWDMAFFITREFLAHTPIFPSLGNHEIYGPSGRVHYMRHLAAPGTRVAYYDRRYGPVRVIALDSNEDFDREGRIQIEWLEQRLAESSDARFTFVVLHHGPISSGRHGGHEAMRELGVAQMIRDAGVDIVFSGHDHMYERGDDDGYRYIVTGGGGAPLYLVNRHLDSQLAFVPEYHYLRVDIDDEDLRVSARKPNGETIERCDLNTAGWSCSDGEARGPIMDCEEPDETVGTWRAVVFAAVSLIGLFLLWRSRRRHQERRDEPSE